MDRPCIFISAVSAELAGARRTAARVLGTLGYDPVSEEDFPTGHGELKAWLTEQIDACEGVIQLVGETYGAEPPVSEDRARPWPDPELGRCSYTQYEFLYAWKQGKRTWVILIEPGYPRDASPETLDLPRPDTDLGHTSDPAAYQAERRALQRAYIERLKAGNHLRHKAGNETELENLLLRLKDELKALRTGERRRWRRLGWAIAAVLAGLLVLGGGGWFAYERLSEQADKIATVTTQRIRAHLRTAVQETYRRDLAQADQVSDWQARERRREAAEAQRTAQLARIDDLAASFAEIEHQGETTSVFKELTRILEEQGVTEALAYTQTKRPGILERVRARQAAARARDRAELEPLLTSARLYATQGEAEAARGRYAEVLDLEPDWPSALHDSLWFLIDQGDLAVVRGSLPEAKRDYAEAQEQAGHLLELEPDNPEWQRDFAISTSNVAEAKVKQGDLAGAVEALEEVNRIFAGLVESDPSNAGWQRDLYMSHWRLATIAEQHGEGEAALGHWRRAYKVLQGIADRGLHMTAEDREFLEELRLKLQIADDPGGVARQIEAKLEKHPDDAELYTMAQALYHEQLFDYTAAHRVTAAWVARHPEDLGARCNLAETLLTTDHTLKARDALGELIAHDVPSDNGASTLDAGTEAALRLLDIAALTRLAAEEDSGEIGNGPGRALATRRSELEEVLAAQPEDFTIAWSFRGTLNYIATDPALADYQDTLLPLFEAANRGRDALLERLRQP